MFISAPYGGKTGFLAEGCDHELIVVEQAFIPFFLFGLGSVVTISQKLVYGLFHWVCDLWGFAFYDNKRNAVDKEYDIRDDVCMVPQDIYLKLGYCEEAVVFRMLEVYVFDCRTFLACCAVLVYDSVIEDEVCCFYICFDEGWGSEADEFSYDLFYLVLGKPGVDGL